MSVGYRAVQWNRQKYFYDALLAAAVLGYLAIFYYGAPYLVDHIDERNLAIRAYGSAAFVLLHVILSIGPLARLEARFLPFLYNRRHMGVAMCVLALLHANAAIGWYHQYGLIDPYVSLLVSNLRFDSLAHFPFELLGIGALLIFVTMAVTSHDFWLHNLSAPTWKALHMGVYGAYALIVGHVVLGVLQSNGSPLLAAVASLSAAWIIGIHLLAARKEARVDREAPLEQGGWIRVGRTDDIPLNRGRVVVSGGERIAVFRYEGNRVSAISAVCQHQNGPLGEGAIIDGLVTCPWHGFQYDPCTGASPPPFTECVPTFDSKVMAGVVYVHPKPHAPGTRVAPALAESEPSQGQIATSEPFYVGYLPRMAPELRRFILPVTTLLITAVIAAAPAIVLLHTPYAEAHAGGVETLEGWFLREPVPRLVVPRPNSSAASTYLLTGLGKYGVKPKVLRAAGGWARVKGILVYRDGATLLAVRSAKRASPPAAVTDDREARPSDLGLQKLVGEIVDSKCYLGVMRPGHTKTHRGCAVRCIAGGIPPMLLVRDQDGNTLHVILVGPEGKTVNREVLPYVAEPIEVEGRVYQYDDLLVMHADLSTIRRL